MLRFIKTLLSKKANPSSKAESVLADEAAADNAGPMPDDQSTDDVSTPSGPTEPTIPAAAEVEIQRRFNEFERRFNERQKEILEARAAHIERWLVAISVVAVVGGYFGFTKFDKIEDEARQHVTAAKQHAEKAQTLVKEIEAKYGESVSLVAEHKKLTAETVSKNPDEAGRAAESVQENPAASLIDRAMAAAVQLQLQGEIEKAAEKWRAIIHIAEGNDNDLAARAWFSVGYLFYLQEKREDAIAAYAEAIRLKPDYNVAYSNRGVVKNSLGHHEAAIADYDEAIRLKLDDDVAYFNRGNAKNSLGHYEAAIADYNQTIRLQPDFAQAYFGRGNAKGELDRYEAAIADYDEAIRLKPDYAEAYNNRGNAKGELDRYEAAIADYNQTIRLQPDFAQTYFNRGLAKDEMGRIDEARQDFEKARDLAHKAGDDSLIALADQRLRNLDSQEGE